MLTAIITAAGQATRMGGFNKIFADLGGAPVLARSLEGLYESGAIDHFILLIQEQDRMRLKETVLAPLLARHPDFLYTIALGGARREETVQRGLALLPEKTDWVLVHDGARPFVTGDLVQAAIHCLEEGTVDGYVAAVPVRDTIKRVDGSGLVVETPVRASLYQIQTPQLFRKEALLSAYEKPLEEGEEVRDDAGMLERIGRRVAIFPGRVDNIKLTWPIDLKLAELLWEERDEKNSNRPGL